MEKEKECKMIRALLKAQLSDDMNKIDDKCNKNGYSPLDIYILGLFEALGEIEQGEAHERSERE